MGQVKSFKFRQGFIKTRFVYQFLLQIFPLCLWIDIEASEGVLDRIKEELGDHNPFILQSNEHFTKGNWDTDPPLIIYTVLKATSEHELSRLSPLSPTFSHDYSTLFFCCHAKSGSIRCSYLEKNSH